MSGKNRNRNRNRNEKKERRPPSHVALESIQAMTNVLMCRSCGMKMFCPNPMQCRMEAILEAKVAMITDKMGEKEVRKLTRSELAVKIREISDEDTLKFMGGEDVELDKESQKESQKDETEETEEQDTVTDKKIVDGEEESNENP